MRRRSLRQYMLIGAISCAIFCGLGAMLGAPVQTWGDQDTSRACALQLILNARKLGYKVRNGDFGYLEAGKSRNYRGLMYRGSSYMVVACGDQGVTDLDLFLHKAPSGDVVAADSSNDRTPTLLFTPTQSGLYVLRVKMHSGSGNYTVAILYK